MELRLIPAYDRVQEIGTLFQEYTELLIAGDPSFRDYLALQNYEAELSHLEEKYGPPDGRLYLAYCGGALAGCIGLRRMDGKRCEMKRLYVRPQFRGKRVGERLVERIIAEAKAIGYTVMLLDTLPFLDSAIRLYRKFGFYKVGRYNDNPIDTSVYLRLDLK